MKTDFYIIPMSYEKAISVIKNSNENTEEQIMCSAIYKILSMETINAVTKDILKKAVNYLFNIRYDFDPLNVLTEVRDRIKALPSAQPERKKGRWIPVDSYSAFGGDEATWMAHGNPVAFYYCSECKEQAYAGEDGESLLTDYCPNCGADMRGEQDE